MTNGSGASLATNTYDEYGLPGSGALGRFQYTGQAWLPEVGLYDYKARMYSPSLGRFLQPDPIGYADGMNWYTYAHGDPVNGTDPSGTVAEVVVIGHLLHAVPNPIVQVAAVVLDIIGFFFDLFGGGSAAAQPPSHPTQNNKSQNQDQKPNSGCRLVAATGRFTNRGADARFAADTAAALSNALADLNSQGILPVMTSGYRSPQFQAALRAGKNPFIITPARVSWHQVGGAVDFGPNSNAGNNGAIRSAMAKAGFVWGGKFRIPDAPHFQNHPSGTSPSAALVNACTTAGG